MKNNNLKLLQKNWREKRILILGFGREGTDTFLFLRKLFPEKILGIADILELKEFDKKTQKLIKSDKKNKLHLGKNYLKTIKNYDVIIKSPGIPPKTIAVFLRKKSPVITSQTEIFLRDCPGKIIGITGTKGKSTTASLIYKILKEGDIKSHLIGNIGNPVLSFLLSAGKKDVFVYELSSFQLINLKKSPQIAVFLNIYHEHLDYYRNFNEYIKAKSNITCHQTNRDYLIFNSKDEIIKKLAKKSKAKTIDFNSIKIGNILKIKEIPLKGIFNIKNIKAAVAVGKLFKVSNKNIAVAVKKFKILPHRLEFVGKFKGISFYNDSLSTIPEATMAAFNALGSGIDTLIAGGFDRGQNFKGLIKKILKNKIKTLILFPDTGKRIWNAIPKKRQKELSVFFEKDMKNAVKLAFQNTEKEKICLLSPASPSFGIFKDYRERGNLFKKYVRKYK